MKNHDYKWLYYQNLNNILSETSISTAFSSKIGLCDQAAFTLGKHFSLQLQPCHG